MTWHVVLSSWYPILHCTIVFVSFVWFIFQAVMASEAISSLFICFHWCMIVSQSAFNSTAPHLYIWSAKISSSVECFSSFELFQHNLLYHFTLACHLCSSAFMTLMSFHQSLCFSICTIDLCTIKKSSSICHHKHQFVPNEKLWHWFWYNRRLLFSGCN